MIDESKEYYVAFIDVLGFTEMVYDDQFNTLQGYINTVQDQFMVKFNEEGNVIKILSISDSIILLTLTENEANFMKLIEAVQEIQAALALKDIWLRGAISFGMVYYVPEKNILIGKGFINAYNLEKEAIYPRVIIDPKIIIKVSTDGLSFKRKYNKKRATELTYVKRVFATFPGAENECTFDVDAMFICYGSYLAATLNDDEFATLYSNIKNHLYSSQKTYHKFFWLRNYFNYVIQRGLSPNKVIGEEQAKQWKNSFFKL